VEFFRGVFETSLGPQDVLTEIRVPTLGTAGWSYLKFTRPAQDWATVGIAAVVRRTNGTIENAAIALTNMGPTPVRARTAEEALRTPDDVGAAAEVVAEGTDPQVTRAAAPSTGVISPPCSPGARPGRGA
jgi:aerobic carbon-monoxide dehydrogenase medium subunit